MNRYLISSSKFSGDIELMYTETLQVVDFTKTDLNPQHKQWLVRHIPVTPNALADMLQGFPGAKIVREDAKITFDMFWLAYGHKVNKDRCVRIWNRLSVADQAKAYFGVVPYNRHLAKNTWKSRADPDTYLRNKYWNNEYKD